MGPNMDYLLYGKIIINFEVPGHICGCMGTLISDLYENAIYIHRTLRRKRRERGGEGERKRKRVLEGEGGGDKNFFFNFFFLFFSCKKKK